MKLSLRQTRSEQLNLKRVHRDHMVIQSVLRVNFKKLVGTRYILRTNLVSGPSVHTF